MKENQNGKNIFKELIPYIVILVIVILIRSFLFTPVKVSGPSMNPTLKNKDTLILYKLGKLERFKIVVIETKNDYIIKRIIGLPGEKIEMKDNILYINGNLVEDNYKFGNTKDFGPIELKNDEYYVLGDNREDSTDSRILGPIKKENIIGTTHIRLFPLKSFGNIDK